MWKLGPGKFKTRDGGEAEVFALSEGRCFGRVEWTPASWSITGGCICCGMVGNVFGLDILPPEPVKKWRWVMAKLDVYPRIPMGVTDCAYETSADAEREPQWGGWQAIQRIDATLKEE